MNNLQIRQIDRGKRRHAFLTDNSADFPLTSPGGKVTTAIGEVITLIQNLAAEQSSGAFSQNIGIKDDNFDKLKKMMRKMNRAANSLGEEIDGLEDLFRLPRSQAEEIWLARARQFHTDSAAHEAAFFDYDLAETYRADLMGLITAIEASGTAADIAQEQRGGATGGLEAAFRDLGRLGRKANNIVENKYEDDAEKLAAWAIASHLEAAPKRKDDDDDDDDPPPVV